MTMPTLHIRLLGDFSLIYDDRQVTSLNTTRLQSLLAFLVLHRDVPQQRQHLAFLFWPDATEAQARNNLRQLLHQLRQALPAVEQFLSADTHMLHWHPVTPCHLDVAEFEQTLALADAATQRNDQHPLQAALEQADSLYRGELLPGCYDEWILPERDRLRQRHLQVLEQLLRLFEAQGDTVTAIRYAQRLIGLDPLSEDLYPINGAVHRASTSDTAFSFREANFAEVIVGVDPDPANNERMVQWARDYWMALHPYSAGGGYINMMMDEGADNVKAAYRDNYARLAQIKATYEPGNLFHVNQNITPGR